MAMPFNTVGELAARTAFSQGETGTEASVIDATFSFSQFQTALQDARDYIYRRTTGIDNADFTADRLAELKQAEIYLALSTLFEMYGEEIPLKSPDANLAAVSSVTLGAD